MNAHLEPFAITPYEPALLALAVLSLIVLLQALLTAPLAFLRGEQSPGAPVSGDYTWRSFRVLRTHANSVESLGPFGFALLAAMIAGSHPLLVNGLAAAHVVFRALFWVIYYGGFGKTAGGPRTLCFIGGLATNIVLAGAAITALAR